jgi:oligosaccharide repeat unit polymerase
MDLNPLERMFFTLVSKIQLKELSLILLIKLSLDIAYVYFVSIEFEYMGFYLELNLMKVFESYLITIVLFLLLDQGERKISTIITKFLYLLMIIPTLSLYAMKDESRLFLYFFVFSFLITLIVVKLPRLKMLTIRVKQFVLFIGLILVSCFTYAVLIANNGLPTLKGLNLLSVYEIRDQVNYGPSFMNYLVVWQAKIINLFLIGIAWHKKRNTLVFIALGLQVLLFLMTGHKSFLFTPFLLLATLYAVEKRKMLIYSGIGIISVTLTSFIIYLIGWSGLFGSLFIRRQFFVPAQNYFYYYDYFSQNKYMYLSHSVFKSFINNPYDTPIPNLIGSLYYNEPTGWINTGYLGDAYMNFGFIGMIMFSILLGAILLFLDSLSRKLNISVVISATIIGFQSLVNGALLTSLLTGGLLLAFAIIFLYSNTEVEKQLFFNKERKNKT